MADDPKIYLIDEKTGKARRNAIGEKQLLADYENDADDADVLNVPAAQVEDDIERLGLSEFLPENEK